MSNLEKLGGMEALAAELHNIYQEEAKRQGDVRHKDKYEDLPDNIKQFDRVLAAFILGREQALIERVEELERDKAGLQNLYEVMEELAHQEASELEHQLQAACKLAEHVKRDFDGTVAADMAREFLKLIGPEEPCSEQPPPLGATSEDPQSP